MGLLDPINLGSWEQNNLGFTNPAEAVPDMLDNKLFPSAPGLQDPTSATKLKWVQNPFLDNLGVYDAQRAGRSSLRIDRGSYTPMAAAPATSGTKKNIGDIQQRLGISPYPNPTPGLNTTTGVITSKNGTQYQTYPP